VSTAEVAGNNMKMETKFLQLRTPVELGSRFGDWSVCWLGGWQKHRMFYLVMLVKLKPRLSIPRPVPVRSALAAPEDEL
jgi:hypothetical protein